ncbi:MAG: helix-turn-helix transcriptional regulator [Lachnospiraceae bacterium]|nr:helix-turn-helix transcriptional regulator [Lachnospiraceae bacterium]
MKKKEKTVLISLDEIRNLLHENAENTFSHTTYREEQTRFHLLLQGDYRAVEESVRIMEPALQGKLSKNPLRNIRYLFIVNTALLTRYMIEIGIPQEQVYAISDLYIQKADVAKSEDEIRRLNREIWERSVDMVRDSKKKNRQSRTMRECLNYIDTHFNEKITLQSMGEYLNLNPCYLATLFKKEMGETFASYLIRMRIKTAEALLRGTDYSYTQIAYSLAFCSQSHFIKCFRQQTGYTPMQYRTLFWDAHLSNLTMQE